MHALPCEVLESFTNDYTMPYPEWFACRKRHRSLSCLFCIVTKASF